VTTLTKAALLDKGKPRVELIKAVPGLGDVWLRSVPEVQRSRRQFALFGPERDKNQGLHRVHSIIDQVMLSADEPMFNEADAAEIAALDSSTLDVLIEVIREFNDRHDDQKKESAE
jgi:hypothetical protein